MSLLSVEIFSKHQSPMYITLKEGMKEGDPIFMGICEQKASDGQTESRYIMRCSFFIDSHLGYGIEEKVAVGVVESSRSRTISALGVWEIAEIQANGRAEIRPTWNYSEAQLADLLSRANAGDEARAVHMSYRDMKFHMTDSRKLAA